MQRFTNRTLALLCIASSVGGAFFPVLTNADQVPPLPIVSGEVTGKLGGSFELGGLGSASYSIPLAVPPGTAGVVPGLTLAYGGGSKEGILGERWTLNGLSSVTRCGKTIGRDGINDPITFDYGDKYCLDGQRLIAVTGPHGGNGTQYRTESESFARVTSYGDLGDGPAWFVVEYKNGQIATFGGTDDARMRHVAGNGVLAWKVSKVADRSGNEYNVTYQSDINSGENLPLRIDYTSNPDRDLAAYNSVRFEYGDIPHPVSRYLYGAQFKDLHHLRAVKMFHEETLAWEYRLTYTLDTVIHVERLAEVMECDGQGVCLPPTRFTWGGRENPGEWFSPGVFAPYLSEAHGFRRDPGLPLIVGDWNRDGKMDLARAQGQMVKFLFSTGNGWAPYDQFPIGPPDSAISDWSWYPIVSGDFNGDGFTDVLRIISGHGNNGTRAAHVFYSTGPYFNQNPLQVPSGRYAGEKIISADFTGDGRSDIIWPTVSNSGADMRCAFHGYECNPQTQLPFLDCSGGAECPVIAGDWDGDGIADVAHNSRRGLDFMRRPDDAPSAAAYQRFFEFPSFAMDQGYTSVQAHPYLVGDWNGDGLSDVGRVGPTGLTLCSMTGRALVDCTSLPLLSPAQGYTDVNQFPLLVGDWNGDGMSDIARVRNNELEFYAIRDRGIVNSYVLHDFSEAQGYVAGMPITTGDFNGDGMLDIVRVGPTGITTYYGIQHRDGFITRIEDGAGVVTSIEYAPLTDQTVYNSASGATYPTVEMQPAMTVVRQVTVSDGHSTSTDRYSYSGLRGVVGGGGVYGFQRVTDTDVESGIETTTWYHEEGQFSGLPRRVEKRVGSGGPLFYTKDDTWARREITPERSFTYIQRTVETSNELDGTLTNSITTENSYDDWGNLSQESKTWNDGATETTINHFINEPANWRIGLIDRVEVVKSTGIAGDPMLQRVSQFEYYPDRPLIAREVIEPDDAVNRRIKTYEYDQFGNITSVTTSGEGVAARIARSSYDATGRFALTSTNSLGHVVRRVFDPIHGVAIQEQDPNGLITSRSYDGFGRPVMTTNPDGTQHRSLTLKANVEYAPNAAHYFVRTDSSGQAPKFVYYDGSGRELRKVHTGFDGRAIFTDTEYDAQGRVARVSEPYFEGNPQWTAYQYDALGRPIHIVAIDGGETTITYQGVITTVRDPLGHEKIEVKNASGRVIQVIDALGGTLSYRYDGYGNPIAVTDAAGNTITSEYDRRGRKVRSIDRNSGTSTMAYDPFDQLVSQTNGMSETISYQYDQLGRVISKQSPQGIDTWQYDSALYGIGKLAEAKTATGYTERFAYDVLGRVVRTEKRIGSRWYATAQSYDLLGRVATVTYPSSFAVKNIYNQFGYLAQVERATDGKVYWTADVGNAWGQLEQFSLGNGLIVQNNFGQMNGLITGIQAIRGVSPLLSYSYSYDPVGNLTRRRDNIQGNEELFTYDPLYRLLSAHVVTGTADPVTMQYDAIGNILSRSDVGSYLYGERGAGPHAVTSIVGAKSNSYDYNQAGRRIRSNNGSINYDASGMVTKITKGNAVIEFDLDESGQRVMERTYQSGLLKERKSLVDSLYERIEESGKIRELHYIRAGSSVVATYTISGVGPVWQIPGSAMPSPLGGTPPPPVTEQVRYLIGDHLGSVQAITDDTGALVERLSFDSWGNRRNALTWEAATGQISSELDRGFTGHEQLDAVALIHMNGRVYDPVIGRFVSPDPIVQAPHNMQNYNRYSYVMNNPLSITDPSGYFFKKLFRGFRNLVRKALPIVVTLTAVMTLQPAILLALQGTGLALACGQSAMTLLSATVAGAVSKVAGALVTGQGLSDSLMIGLRAAPYEALRVFTKGLVGDFGALDALKDAQWAVTAAHGLTGGGLSVIQGGKFSSGFAAELFTSISERAGLVTSRLSAAVVGGTASSLAGGKFEDGAIAGAYQYMYNYEQHGGRSVKNRLASLGEATAALGELVTTHSENLSLIGSIMGYTGTALLLTPLAPVGAALLGIGGSIGTAGYIGGYRTHSTDDMKMAAYQATADVVASYWRPVSAIPAGEAAFRFLYGVVPEAAYAVHKHYYPDCADGSCAGQR